MNKLALVNQLWNIEKNKDRLWTLKVHEYYIKNQTISTMTLPTIMSWILKKIFEQREHHSYNWLISSHQADYRLKALSARVKLKWFGELSLLEIMLLKEVR